MNMNKFNTVCIVGKYKSSEVQRPVAQIIDYLQGEGVSCLVDDLTAQQLNEMHVELNAGEQDSKLKPKASLPEFGVLLPRF